METTWVKHKNERAEEQLCKEVQGTPCSSPMRKQKYRMGKSDCLALNKETSHKNSAITSDPKKVEEGS